MSTVDDELHVLCRQYEGLIQRVRLESYGDHLESDGPVPVRHASYGFSRDRVRLDLIDGIVLRLKLYWPVKVGVYSVRSLSWRPDQGWGIGVITNSGEPATLLAWKASVAA